MERREIDALLSEGMAAEQAGRVEDAKVCAVILIDALRLARSQGKRMATASVPWIERP